MKTRDSDERLNKIIDNIVSQHPELKKDATTLMDVLVYRGCKLEELSSRVDTLEAYITCHNIERRESMRKQLQPVMFAEVNG